MKKLLFSITGLLLCFVFISISNHAQAQLWNKVKNEVKNRAENHVIRKSGDATDAAMNKTEKEIGKAVNENKQNNNNEQDSPEASSSDNSTLAGNSNVPAVPGYKNYDFVPGDKIIFQPDLSAESDAELPARFTVQEGNAEIQTFEGEKILHLDKGSRNVLLPLMNSDKYLPEKFTVEMDMMYETEDGKFSAFNTFAIEFREPGDNMHGTPPHNLIIVQNDRYEWGDVNASRDNLPAVLAISMNKPGVWHHIAIYINKNIGKGYIDQYRIKASNTLPTGFGFIDIKSDGHYGMKIKNVRIAAGGDDKYNKIVTDGKFITHGILFDVNKSSIKPESMGALNEIAKLMKDHNDLKFEIDGHTDSDGNADANMKLSQSRADAVKEQLVKMGIDESRLTTKGFGATKPMDKNDNAEGKANNRRVEFVKS